MILTVLTWWRGAILPPHQAPNQTSFLRVIKGSGPLTSPGYLKTLVMFIVDPHCLDFTVKNNFPRGK